MRNGVKVSVTECSGLKVRGQRSGLRRAALVTCVVLLGPLAVSWGLVAGGVLTSAWESVGLGCVMSLLACELAGLWWERNRGAADVLFSDLLIWGWLRRRAIERRLADAAKLFSPASLNAERLDLRLERPQALLRQLATDLEAADPHTHGHSRRVARYASMIAQQLLLAPSEVDKIRLAAALHDIGKLHTPRQILDNPCQLTDSEFGIVKLHPGDGANMIAAVIHDPELVAIVRHHHERLDGNGYPDRLAADDIPIGARIIAVADTFDAITSVRSYRQSRTHKAALDVMSSEAGAQLDPDAVKAFRITYFGQRWLWLPAAAINGGARMLAAAAARLGDIAAITASSAALGAGLAVVPIVPAAPSSLPLRAWQLASTARPDRRAVSRQASLALRPHGASLTPASDHGARPGQPHRSPAGLRPRRHDPAPSPTGAGSGPPVKSGGSASGSAASGSGSGDSTSIGPSRVAIGNISVTVAGPTATASGGGITTSATTPVGPPAGATATASSGTVSVSVSAARSNVGVTANTGHPTQPSIQIPRLTTAAGPLAPLP